MSKSLDILTMKLKEITFIFKEPDHLVTYKLSSIQEWLELWLMGLELGKFNKQEEINKEIMPSCNT